MEHLYEIEDIVTAPGIVYEFEADYLSKLKDKSKHEDLVNAWEKLVERNPENKEYLVGLEKAKNSTDRKAFWEELATKYPKATSIKVIPLEFLEGEHFSVTIFNVQATISELRWINISEHSSAKAFPVPSCQLNPSTPSQKNAKSFKTSQNHTLLLLKPIEPSPHQLSQHRNNQTAHQITPSLQQPYSGPCTSSHYTMLIQNPPAMSPSH